MLTMLSFSSCANKAQSVDLSQVSFEGLTIGDNLGQIDLDKYTEKHNVSDHYTYNFEEWRISVGNSAITEMMASFDQVSISVNGKEDCYTVDDIIDALGTSYRSSWYDREQSLMQLQYFDKEKGIQCSFIYDKNSNSLVWGIMQKV